MTRVVACVVVLAGCADLDRLEASSRCGEGALRLCSGFEGIIEPPLVANVYGPGAELVVDEGFAFRGEGSVRARLGRAGEDGKAQLFDESATFDDPPVEWVRAFVFTADAAAYSSHLIQVQYAGEPYYGVILLVDGQGRLLLNSWSAVGGELMESGTRLPEGRWVCLELGVGPGRPIEVLLDGEPVRGLEPPAEAIAPDLTQLFIGPVHQAASGAGTPAEAWFDEVAVGDARIGCDR